MYELRNERRSIPGGGMPVKERGTDDHRERFHGMDDSKHGNGDQRRRHGKDVFQSSIRREHVPEHLYSQR